MAKRSLLSRCPSYIHYDPSNLRCYQSKRPTIPGDLVIQERRFENVGSHITKFVLISMTVAAQDELIPNSVLAVDREVYQGYTRYISS